MNTSYTKPDAEDVTLNTVVQTLTKEVALSDARLSDANRKISELEEQARLHSRELEEQARLHGRELEELKQQNQITLLESRDYVIGVLAELGEARARLSTVESSQDMTMKRLVDEMTRAYNAESRVIELESQIHRLTESLRKLEGIHHSRSFRIGRAMTAPVRFMKTVLR